MIKECSSDKIFDDKSKRCVKRTGKVGKKILNKLWGDDDMFENTGVKFTLKQKKRSTKSHISPIKKRSQARKSPARKSPARKSPKKRSPARKQTKECSFDEIFNKDTNRCVKRTGKVGKKILNKLWGDDDMFENTGVKFTLKPKKRSTKSHISPIKKRSPPRSVSSRYATPRSPPRSVSSRYATPRSQPRSVSSRSPRSVSPRSPPPKLTTLIINNENIRLDKYSKSKWEKYVPKQSDGFKKMVKDLDKQGLHVVVSANEGYFEDWFGGGLGGWLYLNNPSDNQNKNALEFFVECSLSSPGEIFPNVVQVYQTDPMFIKNEINFITDVYTDYQTDYQLAKKFIKKLKRINCLVIEPNFVKIFERDDVVLRPEGLNGSNYVKKGLSSYPNNKYSELCGKALTYYELAIVQRYLLEKRFGSSDYAQEMFDNHDFLFNLKFY